MQSWDVFFPTSFKIHVSFPLSNQNPFFSAGTPCNDTRVWASLISLPAVYKTGFMLGVVNTVTHDH